ncbi:ferredoxin family protein [Draconibacterium sp. IB214405]|uniref:4Fe-4S dicluster domain-containing protein n=1 Tax=Draconibacterium sp. IB214405 TaxID=3097352 RepID=UPI002A1656BE|nr:ferredoxin family protein [Draconibacterium sp. IB214405]MDX8338492.1 ferredoxin family protein [Draconibacterium sp. IB214405]
MSNKLQALKAEMPAANPIIIDDEKCIACNKCVEICQVDLFIPGPEKGTSPMVLYPGECWYCGNCVVVCPVEGAITLRHPLMNQARWVAKSDLLKDIKNK